MSERLYSSNLRSDQIHTLRWQFQLTWKLAADVHIPALTDEACLWEPVPHSWTVRRSADGRWRPDWMEPEPDPPPTVTIGWLTWHILWWWSGLLSAVQNETPPARQEVFWPGSAEAVSHDLETLATNWTDALSKLDEGDLDRPLTHPWSEPRPLSYALAWCNSELMKNVAEIGYVRLLFEASRRGV